MCLKSVKFVCVFFVYQLSNYPPLLQKSSVRELVQRRKRRISFLTGADSDVSVIFIDSFTKFSHQNYLMPSTFCNRNRNFHMLRDKYVVLNLSYNFYKYNLKYRRLGRSYHFTEYIRLCYFGETNTQVRINEIIWLKIGLGAIEGQSRLNFNCILMDF